MTTYLEALSVAMKAGADHTGKEGYAVKQSAQDTVVVCSAASDLVFGILAEVATAGHGERVITDGIAICSSDGSGTAIAVGDQVGPNTAGQIVKKATADYNICGEAMDASSAAGTMIRVKLGRLVFRTLLG